MSSGVPFSENVRSSADVATLARLTVMGASEGGAATVRPFRTRDRAPGAVVLLLVGGDPRCSGLVLRAATGKPLADYLSEKIWQPMGAEADASWMIDKGGLRDRLFGSTRRYGTTARLGSAARERRRARRSADHPGRLGARGDDALGQAVRARSNRCRLFGYGYQTWLIAGKERQFMLRGCGGRAVFVDPKSKS